MAVNFSAIRESAKPGLERMLVEAKQNGSSVEKAEILIMFERDDLVLDVRHTLLTRRQIDQGGDIYYRMGDVIRHAIGYDGKLMEEQRQALVAARSDLHQRGGMARYSKPTPYRATRKRRRAA